MGKLIYAADDEKNIRDLLKSFLDDAGFETVVFETGDALFEEFKKKPSDLVVLDIMMPGTDGLTICKQLRDISTVPIIILTAKDSEMDYVMGMSYGGDDYLMKPFRPSMLIMRIKALFRRIDMEHKADPAEANAREEDGSESAAFGDLVLSGQAHQITCSGKDLGLTMLEFALLKYMMLNQGKAISRDELLDEVWGISADVETRVTDETVRRVRRKLKNTGSHVGISVIWGYGYKLEELK